MYATIIEESLSFALREAQDAVIGLFKSRYYSVGEYIPVISNEDGVLTCIEVGKLLGLNTLHIDSTEGRLVLFPQGKTLTQMMEKPMEFQKWYKENVN